MNSSYATSASSSLPFAASSSSPPPHRRDHRVGEAAAILPEIVIPPPGICDNARLISNITASSDTKKYWANNKRRNVKKLVKEINRDDGDPREVFEKMLTKNKPLPWTVWGSAQSALGKADTKYTVEEDGKLRYDDKVVLPIEEWHSTFVTVYNSDAQFAQRKDDYTPMDKTTATKVAEIIAQTNYINKSLLAKCILATYSPPAAKDTGATTSAAAAVEPLQTLEPGLLTLEEDQPNAVVATTDRNRNAANVANALVATSVRDSDRMYADDAVEPLQMLEPDLLTLEEDQPNAVVATTDRNRNAANVVNALFATSVRNSDRMYSMSSTNHQLQAILGSISAGTGNNNTFNIGGHHHHTSNTDNARVLEEINTTTKAIDSRTKVIDDRGYNNTRLLDHIASSTKKTRPERTQAHDIGVLGRSGSVDENMVAGGSPLRSMNEFDTGSGGESSGSHSSYVHDIGGRELFGASGDESMAQEQGSGENSSTSTIASLGAVLGHMLFFG